MKTKFLAALATVIILFSLDSCAKSSTDTTTATQTTAAVTSVESTTIAQTATAADTTTAETTTKANPTQTTSTTVTTAQPTTAVLTTKAPTTKIPTTKVTTTKATTTAAPTTEKIPTFTSAELAKFDGKNGSKAYIAYEGTVYDVTDNPSWSNGNHKYILFAGNDLTIKVNNCTQHIISFMKAQFSTYPKVGTYVG